MLRTPDVAALAVLERALKLVVSGHTGIQGTGLWKMAVKREASHILLSAMFYLINGNRSPGQVRSSVSEAKYGGQK